MHHIFSKSTVWFCGPKFWDPFALRFSISKSVDHRTTVIGPHFGLFFLTRLFHRIGMQKKLRVVGVDPNPSDEASQAFGHCMARSLAWLSNNTYGYLQQMFENNTFYHTYPYVAMGPYGSLWGSLHLKFIKMQTWDPIFKVLWVCEMSSGSCWYSQFHSCSCRAETKWYRKDISFWSMK